MRTSEDDQHQLLESEGAGHFQDRHHKHSPLLVEILE